MFIALFFLVKLPCFVSLQKGEWLRFGCSHIPSVRGGFAKLALALQFIGFDSDG